MNALRVIMIACHLLLVQQVVTAEEGPMPSLVDPAWLEPRLQQPDLVVLDIRSPIGGADRNAYEAGHIPDAVYSNFVTDDWHDQRTRVPATLPSIAQLEALLGRLGIGNDSRVVIVHSGTDSADFSTAARVFWTLRLLGHDRMAILDGGFRAWEAAGLPVEQGWNAPERATFTASVRETLLASMDEVTAAMERGAQLVDARPRNQYTGASKMPIAPRAGTLPDAINLEHPRLIDADGRLVGPGDLTAILRDIGLDQERETVTFCNIGHVSAGAWFALSELAGFRNVSLYDGSIAQWAASPDRPMVVLTDR
ncbi:MAG: sulfurtransferase [Aquisalimonadaceae bacterium]